jgi:hypothetical protein
MEIQNKRTLKTTTLTKISAFAFILLLAMTLMMAFALPSFAQVGVPQPEETSGFISVAPTLIGVGQTATVNLWIFPLSNYWDYRSEFQGFHGITVTFVKPNGSEDTFMPVDGTHQYEPGQTQALCALYFFYEPDMAGDWSVSFTMPAQDLTDSKGTVQYMALTSNSFSFTVTEEEQLAGLLNGYPWAELPNEDTYWDYPISSNNREWHQISGDWLGSNLQGSSMYDPTCRLWQPYGSGPNTGHILWSQPRTSGGLLGGQFGSLSYTTGINAPNCVIMEGKVFINIPNSGQFACIDETTGELLYMADGSISNGIHLPGNPHAQANLDPSVVLESSYGSIPTPWVLGTSGTTWRFYDPLSGRLVRSLANATWSSIADPANPSYWSYLSSGYYWNFDIVDGTNLAYGSARGTLFAWDLSKVVGNNWPTGIVWTRDLPLGLANRSLIEIGLSPDLSTMVVRSNPNEYWGFSAEDGTILWGPNLIDYPSLVNEQITFYGIDAFIVFDCVASTFHCYSITTGAEKWESDTVVTEDSPWASTWTVYGSETNDYENLYLMFPDGTMTALSFATGKTLWRSEPIPSTEYPNNAVPLVCGLVMVGGNLYGYAGYSILYQIDPMPRFGMMVCVDAATGDIKYTLNGGIYPMAAANGYVIANGMYDETIYCIGKGPTKTTVEAPMVAIPKGTGVTIRGTVIDMSPASQDDDSQVRFPNGVPAVADEDMSEWMDYLHMQNATLLNAPPMPNGVPVTIDAIDPSGNYVHIGDVTSDFSGLFKMQWTPDEEGEYTIVAGFSGSDSYWSSYATTAVTVGPEPTQGEPQETEEPSAEAPFPTTEVAIVAAVAVVAVIAIAAYWALKRRK